MISLQEVNEKYRDVLAEIGNIGAGNATTAVADMLGLRIDMSVPQVQFLPVEEIGTSIGAEDEVIVGIMLGVGSDIDGSMMFLMDMESAHHIVNRLMMRPDDYMEDFDEMDLSAVKEVGNIIAGSYLSALSGLTGLVDDGRLAGHADLDALRQLHPQLHTFAGWLSGPGRPAFERALTSGANWAFNR